MIKILKSITFVVALMAISLTSFDAAAQGRGGQRGERGDRGDRGGRGNFDPSQFRARIMDMYQERFGFSDAEFKAVKPLIEAIQDKQMEARMRGRSFGGFGFGGGGRGGRGERGGGSGNPALDALQKAVESGNNIEAKLKAYREARAKKEAELKKAQDTLKSVLTVKQEAVAVMLGLIN